MPSAYDIIYQYLWRMVEEMDKTPYDAYVKAHAEELLTQLKQNSTLKEKWRVL